MVQEWGLSFPQAKRDATIRSTKLGRLATVEVSISFLQKQIDTANVLILFLSRMWPDKCVASSKVLLLRAQMWY